MELDLRRTLRVVSCKSRTIYYNRIAAISISVNLLNSLLITAFVKSFLYRSMNLNIELRGAGGSTGSVQ